MSNHTEKLRRRRERWAARKEQINSARRMKYAENPESTLAKARAWREANREDHLRRKRLSYEKNKLAAKVRTKLWRTKNKEVLKASKKRYASANRDKINAYFAEYYSDPMKRLRKNVAASMRIRLMKGKGGRSWEILVGYTVENLRAHLESLFTADMNWDNYGYSSDAERWWTIDHKRSVHSFGYPDVGTQAFLECWSLDNLQPMWSSDNFSKQHRESS